MPDSDFILNLPRRRRAEFIRPANMLKVKVGSGGLSEEILNKAQALLENNATDFAPLAELYLKSLMNGIELAKNFNLKFDPEEVIASVIYPAMQLKANGGMFHYPLVTNMANKLVLFLEVIERADEDVVEIVEAFHTSIRAVVHAGIQGDGGAYGRELVEALESACIRYLEKRPDNIDQDADLNTQVV